MKATSHRLQSALAGALAAGGDPATSPLYVFGPFLRLIVIAGVAQVTFGASIWLAVLTVGVVAAVYRLVIRWVPDGTGGAGLSEEEFGAWAGKLSAGITGIEYTLTFLVSMAALVTFVSDRFPVLNEPIGGIAPRLLVAAVLSLVTVAIVNRGPRAAAIAFGPATAGVLLLLWSMIAATVFRLGFELPSFRWEAFSPAFVGYTLGGYVRILALMTGIEVFANLVAAYDGAPEQRARKAFGSLTMIMGSTCLAMVIVGPAILHLADPLREDMSVFTQTMDALLPSPFAYLGTVVSIAVLLSACATSAEGLQNLGLGLSLRRFVPSWMGRQNRFGVAAWPARLQVSMVLICFLIFGTREETYLHLYAAGVFVLLSMTAWAATKRLFRALMRDGGFERFVSCLATAVASILTTTAAVLIFWERFFDGAWAYLVMVPALWVAMSLVRRQRGIPPKAEDETGKRIACACCGLRPELKADVYAQELGSSACDETSVPTSGERRSDS